jgi:hypothetical protein
MTAQPAQLNTDTDSKRTSSTFADAGDGTSRWFQWRRTANGGDVAQGSTTDAAVTDPTSAGSVVAILKGILTATRLSAAGLLKAEDAAAVSGDSGVMALAIRRDTAVSDVGAAGDYTAIHVDALGRLRVTGPVLEDAAAVSGDAGFPAFAVRRDTAVADGADGDYVPLHVDALGRLRVLTPRPVKASTTALAASLIAKASAGTLYRAIITNTLGTPQFVQIHNTTTVPADTAVPAMVVTVPASSTLVLDLGPAGLAFSTGITLCNSSTAATKTIGAADLWLDVLYE